MAAGRLKGVAKITLPTVIGVLPDRRLMPVRPVFRRAGSGELSHW